MSECQHRSDAERWLEGTWVIDDVRLAVDKGYKILEILEVYEYQVTCYDPATGTGGHFVDNFDTFLKLNRRLAVTLAGFEPRMTRSDTWTNFIGTKAFG